MSMYMHNRFLSLCRYATEEEKEILSYAASMIAAGERMPREERERAERIADAVDARYKEVGKEARDYCIKGNKKPTD